MTLASRSAFLAATLILQGTVAAVLSGVLPLPGGLATALRGDPYSGAALLVLSAWLAALWVFMIVPWTILLLLRMRARLRRTTLAFGPAILTGLALAGTALAAALLGAPPATADGGGGEPRADWMNSDFIMLESILITATAITALALVTALALSFEALRPDAKDIDQVFS